MLRHKLSLFKFLIYNIVTLIDVKGENMRFTKEQAVDTIIRCGKEYKEKLNNTKILVIYRDREINETDAIEILFRPSNFQHLTGVMLVDRNGKIKQGRSIEFYKRCISNPFITKEEILFKEDGTTPLKLSALPALMDLTKITKICGNYNNSKKDLVADAIVGGVSFALAVSKYENSSNEYFPRSALLEDIRNLVDNASQVLAIFQKPIADKGKYKMIRYVAKGVTISNVELPSKIRDAIEL